MAGETVITIIGNLTADPELRTTQNGAQVASFTIAATPRQFNKQSNQWEDGQALFMRCSAWRDLAAHISQSMCKGMRVIAQGRLQQRSYQAQDGQTRWVTEMTVDEIGPSLKYATAQVTGRNHSTGFTPPQQTPRQSPQQTPEHSPQVSSPQWDDPTDPWAAQPSTFGAQGHEPEF